MGPRIDAVGPPSTGITVDSDTSTNDTAIVLANGAAGAAHHQAGPAYNVFRDAFREVCRDLALMMIRDGEGVQRIAEVVVKGRHGRRCASHRAHHRGLAAREDGAPRRRSELGRIIAAAGGPASISTSTRWDIHIGDVFRLRGRRPLAR